MEELAFGQDAKQPEEGLLDSKAEEPGKVGPVKISPSYTWMRQIMKELA